MSLFSLTPIMKTNQINIYRTCDGSIRKFRSFTAKRLIYPHLSSVQEIIQVNRTLRINRKFCTDKWTGIEEILTQQTPLQLIPRFLFRTRGRPKTFHFLRYWVKLNESGAGHP